MNEGAGFPIVEYLRILLGPILGMVLPLTVFYWETLSTKLRLLGIAGILGTVALFLAMGTNKAIADTVCCCCRGWSSPDTKPAQFI